MILLFVFQERELALLLEDNASILNNEEFVNPESVSSNTTCSTITKTLEFQLTSQQRDILQYQFTAVKFHLVFLLIFDLYFLVCSIINTIYFITT